MEGGLFSSSGVLLNFRRCRFILWFLILIPDFSLALVMSSAGVIFGDLTLFLGGTEGRFLKVDFSGPLGKYPGFKDSFA